MKTNKRIEVTTYRRQLSIQYSEPIELGWPDGPSAEGRTAPPQLRAGSPAAERFSAAHVARVNEVTMLVKTLIETEGKSGSVPYSRARKLKLFLRQLKGRINSLVTGKV